jgi:hypothetical protein
MAHGPNLTPPEGVQQANHVRNKMVLMARRHLQGADIHLTEKKGWGFGTM